MRPDQRKCPRPEAVPVPPSSRRNYVVPLEGGGVTAPQMAKEGCLAAIPI